MSRVLTSPGASRLCFCSWLVWTKIQTQVTPLSRETCRGLILVWGWVGVSGGGVVGGRGRPSLRWHSAYHRHSDSWLLLSLRAHPAASSSLLISWSDSVWCSFQQPCAPALAVSPGRVPVHCDSLVTLSAPVTCLPRRYDLHDGRAPSCPTHSQAYWVCASG